VIVETARMRTIAVRNVLNYLFKSKFLAHPGCKAEQWQCERFLITNLIYRISLIPWVIIVSRSRWRE